jgi:two-component system cell cycle response regulator DivK
MYPYDPKKYITKQLPIIKELLENNLSTIPDGCTVLVVEDNVSNYFLLVRMLGHLGIHCEWKTSGYEVVEFANNLPHLDLILMDIRLPYEDGFEAMKKIKLSGHFTGVPIVAVTAEGSM